MILVQIHFAVWKIDFTILDDSPLKNIISLATPLFRFPKHSKYEIKTDFLISFLKFANIFCSDLEKYPTWYWHLFSKFYLNRIMSHNTIPFLSKNSNICLAVISLRNATIVSDTRENGAFIFVIDKILKTIHLKCDPGQCSFFITKHILWDLSGKD